MADANANRADSKTPEEERKYEGDKDESLKNTMYSVTDI